jgi:hypothetical protein
MFAIFIVGATNVDVWVQALKDGTKWKFHDGTLFPIPEYVHIIQTNGPDETRIRYQNKNDTYQDISQERSFYYMCEIL